VPAMLLKPESRYSARHFGNAVEPESSCLARRSGNIFKAETQVFSPSFLQGFWAGFAMPLGDFLQHFVTALFYNTFFIALGLALLVVATRFCHFTL
uniref:hypothetical protein n=2 Tax=Shewanella sp. TaxID=50422 RepID=UPI004048E51A